MAAIVSHNVYKTYPGNVQALTDLNLEIEEGQVFAFLGPNGSGKTTSIKLLNGLLNIDHGWMRVLNLDPVTNPLEIRQQSGIVTENGQMYNNLTGKENLLFYGSLFKISKNDLEIRSHQLLEQLNLGEASNRILKTYSTGMRQRLSLARALLHRPRVLFLDEPTSGLDPVNVAIVNDIIRKTAQEEGTTVFLCSHQLRYVADISANYGLINGGHLLAQGTFQELVKKVNYRNQLSIVSSRPGDSPREEIFPIDSDEDIPQIVRNFSENGRNIFEVKKIEPRLEDIYFKLLHEESVIAE